MLKVGPYVKWKPLKSCISYKNFESLGGGGGGGRNTENNPQFCKIHGNFPLKVLRIFLLLKVLKFLY